MNVKKFVCLCLVLFIALFSLLSCSRNNIKAITVDDKYYYTYYLYSFKDAKINNYQENNDYFITSTSNPPTKTGYVYSSEKLESGDSIKVWNNLLFSAEDDYVSSSMLGTDAVVDEVIDVYYIEVTSNKETYTITYFDLQSKSTVSNKSELREPSKNKIKVTKERVTIEYYTD